MLKPIPPSATEPNIPSNHEVIPEISTDIFTGEHQKSRFAVGVLAVGGEILPGREATYEAYMRLRANVYAGQIQVISKEQVLDDGTEREDKDDARAVHIAVVENGQRTTRSDAKDRVVASMRLILKRNGDNPLPIETFFPESFKDPVPANSNEVSRYICRHEDPHIQEQLKWYLYTSALGYIIAHGLNPTLAVIEAPLERSLQKSGVPISRIGEPQYIEKYKTVNTPVSIDTTHLARNVMSLSAEDTAAIQRQQQEYIYFPDEVQVT